MTFVTGKRNRFGSSAVFAATLSALFLSGAVARAQPSAGGTPCAPEYHATCYSPSQLAQAERDFGRVSSPRALVERIAHLTLAGVAISRDTSHGPPTAIYYSFGLSIPLDKPISKRGPNYVSVNEFAGLLYRNTSVQVHVQGSSFYVSGSYAHRTRSFVVSGRGISKQVILRISKGIALK